MKWTITHTGVSLCAKQDYAKLGSSSKRKGEQSSWAPLHLLQSMALWQCTESKGNQQAYD